jgi:ribulose bisphosphate carboxylase small subunit
MKTAAFVLLILGTILATLGGARLPQAHLGLTLTGLLVLGLGLLLWRLHARQAPPPPVPPTSTTQRDPQKKQQDPQEELQEQLHLLLQHTESLLKDAPTLSLAEIGEQIQLLDANLWQPLTQQLSLLLQRSHKTLAERATSYAQAERYLWRAWSAATDHHRPETLDALQRCLRSLQHTLGSAPNQPV